MINTIKYILMLFAVLFSLSASAQDTPHLGIIPSQSLLDAISSTDIFPDGSNLPDGSGTAIQGRQLYIDLCQRCHGPEGSGAVAEALAGGEGTLTDRYPDKTIGLYWPYASSLFDLIARAMPMDRPASLSNNEVYSLTAYLLAINHIIDEALVLDRHSLSAVQMPNRDGFNSVFPESD